MSTELPQPQPPAPAIVCWEVKAKFSLKASAPFQLGTISVCEKSGLIVFTEINENKSNEKSVIRQWPLETFLLRRRRPKEPQIHLRFVNPAETSASHDEADKDSLAVYAKRLRQDIPPDTYEPDLILDFSLKQGMRDLDQFEALLVHTRKRWVERIEEEQRLDHVRTKKKYVDMYVGLLNKISLDAKEAQQNKQERSAKDQIMSRQEVLATNPALSMLYRSLVLNLGVLDADEFWRRHTDVVIANLPGEKLNDDFYVPMGDEEAQKARLPLLLKESAVIRAKYAKHVEEIHMSETEFWSRLYKSHYYGRLIGKIVTGPPEPLFDDDDGASQGQIVEEKDINDLHGLNINQSTAISQVITSDLNLAGLDAVENKSFGINTFLRDGGFPSKFDRQYKLQSRKATYLTLSDRLNRHASRIVKDISNSAGIMAVGKTPITSSLGTMAALVALEDAIGKNFTQRDLSTRKVDARTRLGEQRLHHLEQRIMYEDLCDSNRNINTVKNANIDRQTHIPSVARGKPIFPAAISIDRTVFLIKLQTELNRRDIIARTTASESATPMSQNAKEFVAKCCFAKFTRVLRSMGEEEKEYLLQEALTCEAMVEVFHEVADTQTHCQELLYHVYKQSYMKDDQRQKIVSALLELKEKIHMLMRIEVDASVKTKLTALVNTRTLCQPILNAIDHAIKVASTNTRTGRNI